MNWHYICSIPLINCIPMCLLQRDQPSSGLHHLRCMDLEHVAVPPASGGSVCVCLLNLITLVLIKPRSRIKQLQPCCVMHNLFPVWNNPNSVLRNWHNICNVSRVQASAVSKQWKLVQPEITCSSISSFVKLLTRKSAFFVCAEPWINHKGFYRRHCNTPPFRYMALKTDTK